MSSPRPLRPGDVSVRAKRIDSHGPVVVQSKTLGTSMNYNLPIDNLSRSGMLLNMGGNRKVPFLINTLVELSVDTGGALFEQPVNCLGKIVRMTIGPERKTQFGVQIIQMEAKDLAAWERAIGSMEEVRAELAAAAASA